MKERELCRERAHSFSASWQTLAPFSLPSRAGLGCAHSNLPSLLLSIQERCSPLLTCPPSLCLASRRTGLEVAAPAAEIFEECFSFHGGETWRRRWLPRQGKRDVETDGCVHREHCLCGEQRVGGCTTRSCSFSNSPGWITPVGT